MNTNFKILKKVLRKHNCLRWYRRLIRKDFDLSLEQYFFTKVVNNNYEIYLRDFENRSDDDFFVCLEEEFHNEWYRQSFKHK